MFRQAMITCAILALGAVSLAGNALAADPVGGPKSQWDTVDAYSSEFYSLRCRGGETTAIQINGDGDTDLDLYVYDSQGRLVASSDSYSDHETIYVTLPYYSETLTIEVQNRGHVYNEFLIKAW